MRKKNLLAIMLSTTGLMACGQHTTSNSSIISGGYGSPVNLTADDDSLFDAVVRPQHPDLHPLKVSHQVVAGFNHCFVCKDQTGRQIEVVVFEPLPGDGHPHITRFDGTHIDPLIDSQSVVATRVTQIYSQRKTSDDTDLYTEEFCNIIDLARAKDSLMRAAGHRPYIDHDILTQTAGAATIVSVEISDITHDTAMATVTTDILSPTPGGQARQSDAASDSVQQPIVRRQILNLKLVKEITIWKVDDVNGEKQRMQKYIEQPM